jgi:hypothetical protein
LQTLWLIFFSNHLWPIHELTYFYIYFGVVDFIIVLGLYLGTYWPWVENEVFLMFQEHHSRGGKEWQIQLVQTELLTMLPLGMKPMLEPTALNPATKSKQSTLLHCVFHRFWYNDKMKYYFFRLSSSELVNAWLKTEKYEIVFLLKNLPYLRMQVQFNIMSLRFKNLC